MPFGFWYIFQDDMIACEPPQFQLAIATFGPIYEELVNALMRKAMYSLQENEWTADQREAFRCYRTDIADTIMYCYVSINFCWIQAKITLLTGLETKM